MINPFLNIKKTILINLDKRQDRLQNATFELERMGWDGWERLSAEVRNPPFIGFNRSQIQSLKICSKVDGITAILEDDIFFPFNKEKTWEIMNKAIALLPPNWKILYLGGMIFSGDYKGKHIGDGLSTAHGLVCTHGMIYNVGVPMAMLGEFDKANIYIQKKNIYDCWIANRMHSNGTCYLVNPMVAWQSAGYSDLSNQSSVGTGMFQLTQLKLEKK